MHSATVRGLATRASVLVALGLCLCCAFIAAAQAQTAATSAPPGKVEQLLKLLDDPEVKAWITAKGAPPVAEIPAVPSPNDFMLWL
ncbi:MAG: hypothetical protein AAAB35_00765, partial [Phyllobacterium sp.]